jgi:integrase/recombinase XerD
MQPILLKPLLHRGGEQIGIFFEKNTEINNEVRKLKGIKWSQTHKCWYVAMNNESMRSLQLMLSKHATINAQALQFYQAKTQSPNHRPYSKKQ